MASGVPFPIFDGQKSCRSAKNTFISPFNHGISRKTNISVGRRCRDAGVDCPRAHGGGAAAPPYHFRPIPCEVHNTALASHPSSSILLPSEGRRKPEGGALIHPQTFATRAAIFEWMEVFDNRVRLHSALGFYSPVDFEIQLN